MQKLSVREITCKTVLHEMDGKREYTANLYKGCSHGCVYCYAPSLIHDERTWGNFVDAKVNAPEVLAREVRRLKKGVVFLSSASDPYQPVEAKYGLTRRVLQTLHRHDFPVVILTRSPLVLRDLDILRKMSWVRVGFSISSVPGRTLEPGVVPLGRRIETLRSLTRAGIKTWVSMAPLVPRMMEIEVEELLESLKTAGVSSVSANALRFQGYDRSREMFERATGIPAPDLMEGAGETVERVRKLVRELGFEPIEDVFEWKPSRPIDEYLLASEPVP
jgi:DNA repair photolyase